MKKVCLTHLVFAMAVAAGAAPVDTGLFAINSDSQFRRIDNHDFRVTGRIGSTSQRQWDACILMRGQGLWHVRDLTTFTFEFPDQAGVRQRYQLQRVSTTGEVVKEVTFRC